MRKNTLKSVLAGMTIVILTLGCGGNGGGGGSGKPPGGGDGQGRATLPTGLNHDLSTLKASTSLSDVQVDGNGRFAARVVSNDYQMVTVDDPAGQPLLLGWIGAGKVDVDVKSTAEVLLYFGAALYLLPESGQRFAARELAQTPQATTLADAIAAEYAGGATSLEDMKDAIRPKIEEAVDSLIASRGILIDPTGTKSGLSILRSNGDTAIRIKYSFRRRAIAHVERISYDDESGNEIPDPERIAVIDVSPTANFNSLIGGLIDLIGSGNLPYAPITTDAIPIPLNPSTASSTKYRVTALGLGASDGDWDQTDDTEKASYRSVAAKTLIIDLFLPIILNIALPAGIDEIGEHVNVGLATEVYQSLVNAFYDVLPNILDKARAGDIKGAVTDVVKAFATSPALQLAVLALLYDIVEAAYGEEVVHDFMTKVYGLFDKLGALDKALVVLDSVAQIGMYAASRSADVFEIDTTGSKVTLTPNFLTIFPTSGVTTFQAVVQNLEPGVAYKYKWKSGGNGRVSSAGLIGQEIESTSPSVVFVPDTGFRGNTSIIVEVYYFNGPNRVNVGADQAEIEVSNARGYLNPRRSSLLPGESQNIAATILPDDAITGDKWYRYTATTNFGQFNKPLGEWTRDDRVTYTAGGTIGKDTISVEIAQLINGVMLVVAQDKGELRVETRKSIIHGTYDNIVRTEPATHVFATVIIPKQEGATRYSLRAYGGYDSWYYGYQINRNSPFNHDLGADQGNVWWHMLSGSFYPPGADPGPAIEFMNSRFGSGWIWEVEVTY